MFEILRVESADDRETAGDAVRDTVLQAEQDCYVKISDTKAVSIHNLLSGTQQTEPIPQREDIVVYEKPTAEDRKAMAQGQVWSATLAS